MKIKIIPFVLLLTIMLCSPFIVYNKYKAYMPLSISQIPSESIDGIYNFNGYSANRLCNISIFSQYLSNNITVEDMQSLFLEKPRYIIKQDKEKNYFCILSNEESINESVTLHNDKIIKYIIYSELLGIILLFVFRRKLFCVR